MMVARLQGHIENVIFPGSPLHLCQSLYFRVVVPGLLVIPRSNDLPFANDHRTHDRVRGCSTHPLLGQTKGLPHKFFIRIVQCFKPGPETLECVLFLPGLENPFKLGHELVDIPELTVYRGEPDVRDLVPLLEVVDHPFSHLGAVDLLFSEFLKI